MSRTKLWKHILHKDMEMKKNKRLDRKKDLRNRNIMNSQLSSILFHSPWCDVVRCCYCRVHTGSWKRDRTQYDGLYVVAICSGFFEEFVEPPMLPCSQCKHTNFSSKWLELKIICLVLTPFPGKSVTCWKSAWCYVMIHRCADVIHRCDVNLEM